MKCPHCHKKLELHRNPIPTVDIIIEKGSEIVLIERKNPPFGWALPGGFVDYGESFESAAIREAAEETGIVLEEVSQFKTYSDPGRDERFHTATTVFIAQTESEPVAGDDAAKAELFDRFSLPHLAFDHAQILAEYYEWKEKTANRP